MACLCGVVQVRPTDDMHTMDRDFEGLELVARRMWIILPTHPFRVAWDWVLIVCVLYSAITVPLEVCFRYEKLVTLAVIDRIVDVYFIFDLVLNFRTAYYNHDGTFQIDPRNQDAQVVF